MTHLLALACAVMWVWWGDNLDQNDGTPGEDRLVAPSPRASDRPVTRWLLEFSLHHSGRVNPWQQ